MTQRVLDRVVQQRGDDGRHVQLEVGQDGGDFERMGEIGIARGAELLAVRLHGIDIGLVEQRLVGVGVIGLHPLDQVGLAHQLAAAGPAQRAQRSRRRGGSGTCRGFRGRGVSGRGTHTPQYIGIPRFAVIPKRQTRRKMSRSPHLPLAAIDRFTGLCRHMLTLRSQLPAQAAARRGAGLRW